MSRIKGLEALFSANKEQFKSKEDCVIAALHCILINADLLCVGLGEKFSDDDSATELLPEGWNENQDLYCLRYRDQDLKQCYLLKIVKTGNNLHVNLGKDEDVSSGITVNTDEFVSDNYDKFSETFKALDKLNENFKQNVLGQVQASAKKSGSSKKKSSKKETSDGQTSPIPAKVPIPQVQPIPMGVPDTRRPMGSPLSAIPRIGGNDLDPLGRSEGSMLFDPSAMGIPSRSPFGRGGVGPFGGGMGLPPHAVPPGARFDPFGPPDLGMGGRFNPDPDHFRPPDYDNMFM